MGFFVPEYFVHIVWFNLIVVSNVKINSVSKSVFTKYLAYQADFLSDRNLLL